MVIWKTLIILLFTLNFSIHHCSESFLATSVYVTDPIVSRSTIFNYQLFLNTVTVSSNDYLLITIPSGITFSTGTVSTCKATSVTATCTITSTSIAKIVYTSVSSSLSYLEGSISNFNNPDSVRTISSIQIELYSSANVLKASSQTISISNFQAASLTVTLSSSSSVVGYTGATLSIKVTPDTLFKSVGKVILTVPEYYTSSGSTYFISSSSNTCSATSTSSSVTVSVDSPCSFNQVSLQATFSYSLSPSSDSTSAITFMIANFNNPITTAGKSGFSIKTQDSSGYVIGEKTGLSLTGISTPSTFSLYQIALTDTSLIQTYTTVQIKLSLSVPMEQNCYVKFIFPSDFTLDSKLSSIYGSGFFTANSVLTIVSKDLTTRTVIVKACEVLYGSSTTGIIYFQTILNPVYMATDSAFSISIAQITSGFTATSSQFTAGSVSSIGASVVDSNYIQTNTNYTVTFTPAHSLLASSVIYITFPSTITMPTSGCLITSKSSAFDSSTISCSFSSQNVIVSNPFTSSYTGGTALSLTISYGTNPVSEQYAGSFVITTYNKISSTNYMVDSGTSSSTLIKPIGGSIYKYSDIVVVSPITYTADQTYKFYLSMDHYLPLNGYILFTIPSEISISSNSLISSNCYDLDTVKLMTCAAYNSTAIKITIDSKAFTTGISSSSPFKFSVKGLKTPRSTYQSSQFYFYSYDSSGNKIDSSASNQYFTVSMSEASSITSISVENSNKTNGITTTYTFYITPNTPIYQDDLIQIRFPSEVTLPNSASLSCGVNTNLNLLKSVTCLKDDDLLTVKFTSSNSISANTQFQFYVYNVQNPSSTLESSAFTDITIYSTVSSTNYLVSTYTKTDVTVQTDTAAQIQTRKLVQENKAATETTIYTITFTPYNAIPSTGSILIKAPSIISVSTDSSSCYVALTSIITGVCTISNNYIKIQNAFKQYSSYTGSVQIVFKATNPSDNSNLQSIALQVYADASFTYIQDETDSGLTPQLECNYPCKRCDQNNPDYCTECFSADGFPQFIQKYLTNSSQTCAYSCYSGYTSNGSKSPKTCTKCDSKCATCQETYTKGDMYICTSCSKSYPFYYSPKLTCQQVCNETQYQCKPNECCDCQVPCKTCVGKSTCRSCFTTSSQPLLYVDKCMASCPSGYTKVGYNCVKCTSPCATCETGAPTSCLTCDGKNSSQFLFGRSCLSECPIGTTEQLSNTTQSKCVGCILGCDECEDTNNAICLKCSNGLALYNNTCITDCPFNYVKSRDGSTCELRSYLLDSTLVYFPFGSAAAAVIIICITAYIITKRKSLILSNAIAFLSIIEVGSIAYQVYYAQSYTINYKIIYMSSFGIALGLGGLNLAFILFYCIKMQSSDISYNFWRQKHYCTVIFVLFLSLGISFKLFRLIYSRFFNIGIFSAHIEDKRAFTRKIQVFSIISIFTFTLPILGFDFIVLYNLEWGSQLYIICAETGGVALINGLFIIFENCCMCSRLSYFEEKEMLKEKRALKQAQYKMIDQSKSMEVNVMGDMTDLEETKKQMVQREDVLKNILKTVKNNRELRINGEFDQLLTDPNDPQTRDPQNIRRVSSMQGLQIPIPENQRGIDERKTQSFPGSPKQLKDQIFDASTLHNFDTKNIMMKLNMKHLKNIKRSLNIQQEFKFDNVYAEKIPPKPEPIEEVKPTYQEIEIQTEEPPKGNSNDTQFSRQGSKRVLDDRKAQESIDSFEESQQNKRQRKKKKQRGKTKNNNYHTQIDEEDAEDQLSIGGDDTSRQFLQTAYENDEEYSRSSDQLNEEEKEERSRNQEFRSGEGGKTSKSGKSMGMSLKDLRSNFSSKTKGDDADQRTELQSKKSVYYDMEMEFFNQRTFNINDILGDFVFDWRGTLVKRKEQLIQNNYRDMNGRPVNNRGYIINQELGCIINKYNQNLMFKKEELDEGGEIPMPYAFEKFNFNPHEIIGNFDYDKKTDKPIILKNKQGHLVDKNLRNVNPSGFLIDEYCNIIDNQGRIKFIKPQLNEFGDIPMLFTYKGKAFDIRDIIGTFAKDPLTKQIILIPDPNEIVKTAALDKQGRKVNPAGYLVNRVGNIVNKNGKIMFMKSQIQFNEPPKLFQFMKFSLNDIRGEYELDSYGNPVLKYQDDEFGNTRTFDNFGRQVNQNGYLIDDTGNIINQKRKVVIRSEILLNNQNGHPTEIPKVFRKKIFRERKLVNDLDQNVIAESNNEYIDEINIENQNQEQNQEQHQQQLQNDQNHWNDQDLQNYDENHGGDDMIEENMMRRENGMNEADYLEQELEKLQIGQKRDSASVSGLNQDLDNQASQRSIGQESHITQEVKMFEEIKSDTEQIQPLMKQSSNNYSKPTKKRGQSSKRGSVKKIQQQHIRQGEKVLQAYNISRPVSSYLPPQYQKRAQSHIRERKKLSSGGYNDYNEQMFQQMGINTITNMNSTQLQSNSDFQQKGNITAQLGYTEEFNRPYPNARIMKNQFMMSNPDPSEGGGHGSNGAGLVSDNPSYNDYLEGDVDQIDPANTTTNFFWNDNSQQKIPSSHYQMNAPQNKERRTKSRRIRQNYEQEAQPTVNQIYQEEVAKYVDQSEDEDDDAIFNENFNVGRQHQRPKSKAKTRSKLRMYEVGSMADLISQNSSDSQKSKIGNKNFKSKKQLLRLDSKLKHLENIYLAKVDSKGTKGKIGTTSVKNINERGTFKNTFNNTSKQKNFRDRFYEQNEGDYQYERDPSPFDNKSIENGEARSSSYVGGRRQQFFNNY